MQPDLKQVNRELELSFVQRFVVAGKRNRYAFLLQGKRREKALNEMLNPAIYTPALVFDVTSSIDRTLEKLKSAFPATTQFYVLSPDERIDCSMSCLDEAYSRIEFGMGGIAIALTGSVAVVISEFGKERFLLGQLKRINKCT